MPWSLRRSTSGSGLGTAAASAGLAWVAVPALRSILSVSSSAPPPRTAPISSFGPRLRANVPMTPAMIFLASSFAGQANSLTGKG